MPRDATMASAYIRDVYFVTDAADTIAADIDTRCAFSCQDAYAISPPMPATLLRYTRCLRDISTRHTRAAARLMPEYA